MTNSKQATSVPKRRPKKILKFREYIGNKQTRHTKHDSIIVDSAAWTNFQIVFLVTLFDDKNIGDGYSNWKSPWATNFTWWYFTAFFSMSYWDLSLVSGGVRKTHRPDIKMIFFGFDKSFPNRLYRFGSWNLIMASISFELHICEIILHENSSSWRDNSNKGSTKNFKINLTLIREFLGPSPSAFSGKNPKSSLVTSQLGLQV